MEVNEGDVTWASYTKIKDENDKLAYDSRRMRLQIVQAIHDYDLRKHTYGWHDIQVRDFRKCLEAIDK